MGAWIAFEMAQEARRRGLPSPAMLIVSGNRAPHLAGSQHDVDPTIMHQLSYPKFWAAFERRYGHNPDLVDNRVRLMTWPLLQADFKLVETYEGPSVQGLDCPLLAVGARDDKRYTADQISAWGKHCQDFTECWVQGGHDYITKSAESYILLNIISKRLSALIQHHSLQQQTSECSRHQQLQALRT